MLVAATSASADFFNNDNGSNWGPFNGASNWGPFSGANNWMNDTDFGFNFNTKNKVDNHVSGKADTKFDGQYADAKDSNMNFFVTEQQAMLREQNLNF
jgi:hypothetical protein